MREVSAKSTNALAMVAVRYQLFLLDPKAEKQNMLIAVDPPFNFPTAVDQIMKTSKFENLQGVVVIGLEPQIDKFLKDVERKDVIDWLDYSCEERKNAIIELAKEHELDVSEKMRDPDSEAIVYGEEEEEVTAKVAYPHDLPEANRALWDAIPKGEHFKLGWSMVKARMKEILEEHKEVTGAKKGKKKVRKKDEYPKNLPRGNEKIWDLIPTLHTDRYEQAVLNHRNKEIRLAVHANFYEIYCAKIRIVPWDITSTTELLDRRLKIKGYIVQGEEVARMAMMDIINHLLDAGLIFKKRALQAPCISRSLADNRYVMSWLMPVTLKPEKGHTWLRIASFIKGEAKKYVFAERDNKRKLVCEFNKGTVRTELSIERHDEKTINIYINHYLTEEEAAILTDFPKGAREKVERTMLEYCNLWKKNDKFPKLHEKDF